LGGVLTFVADEPGEGSVEKQPLRAANARADFGDDSLRMPRMSEAKRRRVLKAESCRYQPNMIATPLLHALTCMPASGQKADFAARRPRMLGHEQQND